MKLGIISDTHDHLTNIGKALDIFRDRGVMVVLHAGDVVAPFAAKALLQFEGPLYAVFGNNDGEHTGLSKLLDIAPPPREFEFAGKRIVVAHEPAEIPSSMAQSADVIITGHTHEPLIAEEAPLRINPGDGGGWLTGRATCVVLDLETMRAEVCRIGSP